MVMGYHQIELAPREGPKTAFSTMQGHWEYRRQPFGLKTAPGTFQKMMNSVFSGLTGTRCFLYLDDIVLYARLLADHNTKLREVLDRLRTYKLKLQPDKCEFLRKEVNYLGHQITEAGVRPDPQKVAAIERFTTPTTAKQLKTFCGMVSYYPLRTVCPIYRTGIPLPSRCCILYIFQQNTTRLSPRYKGKIRGCHCSH